MNFKLRSIFFLTAILLIAYIVWRVTPSSPGDSKQYVFGQVNERFQIKQINLNTHILSSKHIRLISQNYTLLDIALAPPSPDSSDNYDVLYRMESWVKEWTNIPENGIININKLPTGKYTLDIKLQSRSTKQTLRSASLFFEIRPKWYEQPLFFLLIIVLSLLVFGILLLYKNFSEKKKRLLEENMQRLQQVNENLSASMAMNEKLFSLIMHDIRSPLLFLETLCDLIIKANFKSEKEVKERLFIVRDSAGKITTMAESILQWITLQQNSFSTNKQQYPLLKLIETVVSIYEPIAEANNVKIELLVPPETVIYTDSDMFVAITRNLIDNSIKFSKNGTIIITALQKKDELEVSIRDTGPGFTAERLQYMTEIINDPEKSRNTIKKPGFGLMIVAEFIAILGIKCSIENDNGVKFTLVFPIAD